MASIPKGATARTKRHDVNQVKLSAKPPEQDNATYGVQNKNGETTLREVSPEPKKQKQT
uniref:Uncharacterized protein n=1 Tax=Rhizophagus irregularis (strain DAOM 181602 / DAOM 197198 / MUCL 43194) TaxID=747089 RepID=U9TVN6_RHIID